MCKGVGEQCIENQMPLHFKSNQNIEIHCKCLDMNCMRSGAADASLITLVQTLFLNLSTLIDYFFDKNTNLDPKFRLVLKYFSNFSCFVSFSEKQARHLVAYFIDICAFNL